MKLEVSNCADCGIAFDEPVEADTYFVNSDTWGALCDDCHLKRNPKGKVAALKNFFEGTP
jgi:hypothetical protein